MSRRLSAPCRVAGLCDGDTAPLLPSVAVNVGSRPLRAIVCKDGRIGPTRPAPPPWLSLAETVSVGSKPRLRNAVTRPSPEFGESPAAL